MKHSQWLRLKAEGENICSILRQQGYRCTKQVRRLSWKITAEGISYVLTWLPAPVGDWSIIPNDSSPARQKLMLVVQDRLKEAEQMLPGIPSIEEYTRPWAIARILPDAKHYTVARFCNRRDADDHLRVLNRFMPAADFEIVFDVPDEIEEQDDFDVKSR